MEVAGVALAIVPLLISAIEHYSDCLNPLRRYAQYTSGVSRFVRSLDTRKQIYRNHAFVILASLIDGELVELMLSNTTHPKWKDKLLDEQIVALMGDSLNEMLSTITQIKSTLKEIESKVQLFNGSLPQEADREQGLVHIKSWKQEVKAKWRWAFAKSYTEKALLDLTTENEMLNMLCDQTTKLERIHQQRRPTVSQSQVESFKLITRASCNVYKALERGCSKHKEHLARFCLEATVSGELDRPHVKFTIAYGNLVFFVVESVADEYEEQMPAENVVRKLQDAATQALGKRRIELPDPERPWKTKKTVRFAATASPMPSNDEVLPKKISRPLQNLCTGRNLCNHLKTQLQYAGRQAIKLIGMLDEIDCHKHLIYSYPTKHPHIVPTSVSSLKPEKSLQQLLSSLSEQGPTGRLARPVQVRLARLLSTALLQYHATPWLKNWWRSKDIYFFGIEESSLIQNSSQAICPHINVKLEEQPLVSSQISKFPQEGAPNPFMWGLGLLLLEIAFSAPMSELVREIDKVRGPEWQEWYTVKRLSHAVEGQLGTTYGIIVRKCLRCNFGVDKDDLGDPELQSAFHTGVVKELQTLEDDFREWHI